MFSSTRNGPVLGVSPPSGSPRSQARLSKSPLTWQLAQAESPWLELNDASYKNGRPWTMCSGSGLYMDRWPISLRARVSMMAMALLKRVST
jgi:hypothetical protein